MFIPLTSGYFSVYLDYSPYLVYFPTSLLLLVILALIFGSAQFTLWLMCNYSSSVHLTYFRKCLYRPIYYSIEEFYVYTHIMSIFNVCLCVGMFIQEFWPLLRLLILLNLIWWQVSNLSKISRIVLPWIQRSIDSHFGWNHWSIICLSKVSSWVSNVSKEWIWYAISGISGPGVWSISQDLAFFWLILSIPVDLLGSRGFNMDFSSSDLMSGTLKKIYIFWFLRINEFL